MSQVVNPRPSAPPLQKPLPRPVVTPAFTKGKPGTRAFLFDRSNYQLMIVGFGLILLGLLLMAGGKSSDPNVFNDAEIYSFRRITLAPVLMMIGFGIEMWAILKVPKSTPVVVATP